MSTIDSALAKLHHTRKSATVFAGISVLFSLCTVFEYYRLGVSPIGMLALFSIIAFAMFAASGLIGHALEKRSLAIESTTPPRC